MGSRAEGAAVNKAVIYAEPGTTKTEIVELPVEQPGPGQVLVRLWYSGICHTDYAICTNGWPIPPTPQGQIGGHEGVGEVEALGAGVEFPPVGSKVGIKWSASACLACSNCLAGGETTCPTGTVSGFYSPGTFQQYVLSAANYVTPIPDGLDLPMVAPLMCGGITVYTALKRAGVKINDWVLISGAGGGLGHLAIQYARALGAKVLALDVPAKAEFCKDLGADAFVDFTQYKEDSALVEEVKKISGGGGVQIVLNCSSSNRAYAQAMSFLAFRGILVCLGVPEGEQVPIAGALIQPMVQNELRIMAIKSGNRREARECLEIAARGLVRTRYVLRPMDCVTEVFEEMEKGTINGRAVLDLR